MDSTRRNHSAKAHDIHLGNDFLDMTIKSQMTTTKKDKGVAFFQLKIDLEMAIHLISYDTKYIRNSLNSKKH